MFAPEYDLTMSCLSDVDIVNAITLTHFLVEGFSDLTKQIQPASFDLRLHPVLRRLVSGSYDLNYESRTNKSVFTEQLDMTVGGGYVMQPGDFLLASTIETVRLSADLRGVLHNKSTPARMGLSVCNDSAFVDPGFRGQITLELVNNGPLPIVLRPGAMICQLELSYLVNPSRAPYGSKERGSHYQNQKEATPAAVHSPK